MNLNYDIAHEFGETLKPRRDDNVASAVRQLAEALAGVKGKIAPQEDEIRPSRLLARRARVPSRRETAEFFRSTHLLTRQLDILE